MFKNGPIQVHIVVDDPQEITEMTREIAAQAASLYIICKCTSLLSKIVLHTVTGHVK